METIKRIIAVIDPTKDDQNALARSIDLAKKSGASITAFMTVYDFSYEMTTMLSGDEREAMRQAVLKDRELWLKELISPYQNINIDTQVIWHNRPYEAIINTVINDKYDLVIKGTHQHGTLKAVIFTPTDWHILRKCPCPVLLVKDHEWPANGNIIAALNVGSDEDEHQSLNKKITEEAQCLADLIGSNVHLVNSFPGTPVNIAIEIPEFNASEYNSTMLNHHQKAMNTHAEQFGIPTENTHVIEGLPQDVIETIANDLDAELVVLGTIGRTGLSATFIGNTAEHVIDKLNCDVLALKPKGYISPLDN